MSYQKGQAHVLITVRVSREDALFVRQMAGRKNLTVSEYLRTLLGIAQKNEYRDLEYFGVQIGEKHNG